MAIFARPLFCGEYPEGRKMAPGGQKSPLPAEGENALPAGRAGPRPARARGGAPRAGTRSGPPWREGGFPGRSTAIRRSTYPEGLRRPTDPTVMSSTIMDDQR